MKLNTYNKNTSNNKQLSHIIIIDESGSKGYGYNLESPTEVIGVMAAILLDECQLTDFEKKAKIIASKFNGYKKKHITSFSPKDKEQAIRLVERLLYTYNIPWFYIAISTSGYNAQHVRSGNSRKEDLLHADLFKFLTSFGLYNGKSICLKHKKDTFKLTVISDTLETKIINSFKKSIRPFINLNTGKPQEYTFGKDKYQIKSKLFFFDENDKPVPLETNVELKLDIQIGDPNTTLISDIVSYVTYNHLLSKFKEDRLSGLNSKRALKGHPFEKTAVLVSDEAKNFIDNMYK